MAYNNPVVVWAIVVMVAIALGFAVVIWRTWDPSRERELEEASRLPLADVGRSNLDDED